MLSSATALESARRAKIQAGDNVLVIGTTGGVCNTAVLAHRSGAYVFATASTLEDKTLLSKYGAAFTIDYKVEGALEDAIEVQTESGVDVVLHFAGSWADAALHARRGARFVSALSYGADQDRVDLISFNVRADISRERLNYLVGAVGSGELSINVCKTFPLEQAQLRWRLLRQVKAGRL